MPSLVDMVEDTAGRRGRTRFVVEQKMATRCAADQGDVMEKASQRHRGTAERRGLAEVRQRYLGGRRRGAPGGSSSSPCSVSLVTAAHRGRRGGSVLAG